MNQKFWEHDRDFQNANWTIKQVFEQIFDSVMIQLRSLVLAQKYNSFLSKIWEISSIDRLYSKWSFVHKRSLRWYRGLFSFFGKCNRSFIDHFEAKKPLAYVVFNRWHTSLWFKMKLFFCWLRCKKNFFENRPLNRADKPLKVRASEVKKILFSQIDWNVMKTISNWKKALEKIS